MRFNFLLPDYHKRVAFLLCDKFMIVSCCNQNFEEAYQKWKEHLKHSNPKLIPFIENHEEHFLGKKKNE